MNSLSAQELLDSIDQTIIDIDSITGSNSTVDSYLAKFLVVYISGIYEEVFETILIDFTRKNTSRTEISAYVANNLNRYFQNPRFDKVCKTMGEFDEKWGCELRKLINEGRALDSIVNNKNSLAHGSPITITLTDVKKFYADSRIVFEKVDSLAL